jgi:hypothetical protein
MKANHLPAGVCEVFDMGGSAGVLSYGGAYDDPFFFWKAVRPAKPIRDAVSAFLKAHEKEWGKPFVAFHLRNHATEGMNWGQGFNRYTGKMHNYEKKVKEATDYCAKEVIQHSREWCELPLDHDPDEAGRMCTLSPEDVSFMLKAHKAEIDGKDFMSNTGPGKRSWYLASDGSTCSGGGASAGSGTCLIEDKLREYGALTLHPDDWFKAPYAMDLAEFKAGFELERTNSWYIYPMVDLWAAVQADFYFGKVYSTFDESACFMRGLEKMAQSNICVGAFAHYQCEPSTNNAGVCPSRKCHALSGKF